MLNRDAAGKISTTPSCTPPPTFSHPPHIHFAIKVPGAERLTTQCYIKGEPRNARDGVLRGVRDEKQRASVQVPFEPIKDSKIGELAAKFDVVMGFTPKA